MHLDSSKTIVDTEKCSKQKFYELEGIRRYHWFDLGNVM